MNPTPIAERMSKSEWYATQVGLAMVAVVGLLIEELPRGQWLQVMAIVLAALLTAFLSMSMVRSFSKKTTSDNVALKVEVN